MPTCPMPRLKTNSTELPGMIRNGFMEQREKRVETTICQCRVSITPPSYRDLWVYGLVETHCPRVFFFCLEGKAKADLLVEEYTCCFVEVRILDVTYLQSCLGRSTGFHMKVLGPIEICWTPAQAETNECQGKLNLGVDSPARRCGCLVSVALLPKQPSMGPKIIF